MDEIEPCQSEADGGRFLVLHWDVAKNRFLLQVAGFVIVLIGGGPRRSITGSVRRDGASQ